MKKSERWHAFGQNGGWDEWHVFAPTRHIALSHAISYLNYYKSMYLEDTKTGQVWGIEKVGKKYRLMDTL